MPTGKHASDGDLLAWEDGSVNGARRTWLASHLESCLVCRDRLAQFQGIERLIQEQFPLIDDAESQKEILERMRVELDGKCPRDDESS
jgi:hypothetical protein